MTGRARGGTALSLAGLGAAALVAWGGARSAPEAAPVSAEAPAAIFSAERALAHVERLAAEPRLPGTPAHAAALDGLAGELRALGLEPEIQEAGVVRRGSPERLRWVRVRNLVARWPGADPTGVVLLVSHYDSREQTPGAGDAASGVAVILESLRALAAGPPLRNDLVVLITDGEELGLTGAQAFVDEHPWAGEVTVALNFEARGRSGPASMFETGAGSLELVRALRRAVPEPFASSISYEVYRRMPNDTDFSVLKEAGITGMNFAFIGDHAAYHTGLDTPGRLSLASLQHQGENALSLARELGGMDLGRLSARDGVWFNLPAAGLVVYARGLVLPLAAVCAGLALAALALLARRGRIKGAGVAAGLGAFVLTPVAGAAAGWLGWYGVRTWMPDLLAGPHGLPYSTAGLGLALALLAAGGAASVAAVFGRASQLELAVGVALGWSAAGFALAAAMPGASYLALGTGLGLGLAAAGASWAGGGREAGTADRAILAAGVLPAALLFGSIVPFGLQALSLRQAAIFGMLTGLGLTAALPLLRGAGGRRPALAAAVPAAAGVALLVAVGLTFRYDGEHPRVDRLLYLLDADAGEARWISLDAEPDAWTGRALGEEPERVEAPPILGVDRQVLSAVAPAVQATAPEARLVGESRDDRGRRHLQLHFASRRGAPVLRVLAESSVPVRLVEIDGRAIDDAENADRVELTLFGAGRQGVSAVVEVAGRWPLEVTVADLAYGLPPLDPPGPRPPGFMASSSRLTDAMAVSTGSLF